MSIIAKKIKLVEVGPRDGLQNEAKFVPTEVKIEFINRLSQTGLKYIETTSFVSEKKIPQLADHNEVFQGIKHSPQVTYPVLVPNIHGLKDALKAGAKEIAVFTAVSETFCQRNINCSIDESLQHFADIIDLAKIQQVQVRAYLSCCLGCPYEGKIAPNKVANLAEILFKLGCYEVCLGDTIGVGTATEAKQLATIVTKKVPREHIAMHFHDTYGQALTNIYATLEEGIQIFDSSVSGLGGCPYAKGATGNVASEDIVYLLNGLGITTGIDLTKLIAVGRYIDKFLQRSSASKVAQALAQGITKPLN